MHHFIGGYLELKVAEGFRQNEKPHKDEKIPMKSRWQ